jgi:hypothetical protein
MRLSHRVEGLLSNFERLIDGYLAGVPDGLLVAAARHVNVGIDVPVSDLGFGPTQEGD